MKSAFMPVMASAAMHPGLAETAQRLAKARIRPAERRRFRRMSVVVNGRLLDAAGREHDCRTADISPGDARLAAPVAIEAGEKLVVYLDGFGRLAGRVARRCGESEFAFIFDVSTHKRERMAETLTWLVNKDREGLEAPEPRAARAAQPAPAQIELEDGSVIEGEVLDFSLAGVTLRTLSPAPPLGAWARVGAAYGRVARHIEGGFAIDFELGGRRAAQAD
jgi:PilZ domain